MPLCPFGCTQPVSPMGRRVMFVKLPKLKIKKPERKEDRKANANLVIFVFGSLGGVVLVLIDIFIWDMPNFADWIDRLNE